MISVNVRVPEAMVDCIDALVRRGFFASRSDAIKMMIACYQEREKTREFLGMLGARSRDARANPRRLVQLK